MSCRATTQVSLVETRSDFRILENEWRMLQACTPEATGFQTFEWCDAWLRSSSAQGRHVQLRIVVVKRDRQIVFLLPLQIQRVFGVRCARSIGQPATQYQDALALPGEERKAWAEAATKEIQRWDDVDLLHFPQVRDDAIILAGLRPFASGSGNKAPFASLDLSSPTGARKRRRPKTVRRRLRHLYASSDLRLERILGNDQNSYVASILAWKADWLCSKGLRHRGLSSRACRKFFPALARHSTLSVHVLFADDAPIAGELGIISKGTYRSLMSAFRGAYSRYAPGHALTERLMEMLALEGIAHYDFLAPAEPYKKLWCNEEKHLRTVLMPITWRGKFAIKAYQQTRPALDLLRRRF